MYKCIEDNKQHFFPFYCLPPSLFLLFCSSYSSRRIHSYIHTYIYDKPVVPINNVLNNIRVLAVLDCSHSPYNLVSDGWDLRWSYWEESRKFALYLNSTDNIFLILRIFVSLFRFFNAFFTLFPSNGFSYVRNQNLSIFFHMRL